MKYRNLIILGTSHIAKQSMDEVKKHIEEEKPDIIAIELDSKRLPALMSKGPRKIQLRAIRQIGVKGFVFSLIGAWAEKKLGKLVGVAPGSEMKQAVQIAKKNNIKIALVDQDIEITLKRLSKTLTWKEKWNFAADILKSIFTKGERIDFDLRTVPEKKIIRKLTLKLKERYPNVHNVLIEERNSVIAGNLRNLINSNPDKKILAILGAGHVDDVLELVKKNEGINLSYSYSIG
ncbi:MAG TPA: TraB domain-containing protein [Candidatus Nanoarchaeia archaeon]|nr:TraB domain-containing protein [Candidatus Nanoarchaeia archaeon]